MDKIHELTPNIDAIPYQKCPKCDGQGMVSKPPYIAGDVHQWSASECSFTCDVCNGAKIIPMLVNHKPTLTDAEIEAKLKEPNFYIVNAMKNLSKDELRWISLKMLQWSGLTSKEIENMAEREYPFNHIDRDDSQYVTDRINTQRASYIAGIKEIIKILNK